MPDEYRWQAVWINTANLRVELPCTDEQGAREVVQRRLTHPRYPSEKAWVERQLKVKQPPWEVVE